PPPASQLARPVSAPEQIRDDLVAADELDTVALSRDLLQARAEAGLREEDDPQVAGQPRPRLAQRGDLVGLELFEHAQAKLAVLPLALTDDHDRRATYADDVDLFALSAAVAPVLIERVAPPTLPGSEPKRPPARPCLTAEFVHPTGSQR